MTATILVVEDEAVIAADIRMSLLDLGYRVIGTVSSATAALEAVSTQSPDLVLMDIRIQGELDGVDTAIRIRDTKPTPVIFLTSFSDDFTLERARVAGAYGYLLKPFSPRDLKVAIDIALSKRELENRLAERERWFATTLRSIGDAVIATDAAQKVTFMNGLAERLTGWRLADAEGRPIHEVFRLVDEVDGTPYEAPLQRALTDGFAVDLPAGRLLIPREGERRAVDDSISPIVTDKGRVLGGVIVFRDITERKALEKRLAQAERLAAIGTLSAGLAHEINNPLAYVLANVDFALEALERVRADVQLKLPAAMTITTELEELSEALDEAREGSQRVHRIVHELKKFGRVDAGGEEVIEIAEVVEAAIRMTENVVRHHARVRRQFGTVPFVEGDSGQLGQVFVNLLVNAAQAVSSENIERNEVIITTRTDERGWAIVEVRDNGPGIPPELLGRVFDPFFTTKPVGEGSGLGLSICHSLVRTHHGELTVTSEPGAGATFRVALPPAGKTDIADDDDAPVPVLSRRGRVLVVDDEVAIGRAVRRILRQAHDVIVVSDAREILPRLREGESFDVVFCDLMMPGMTGMAFHDAIRAINPELARRIVFMTGGAVTPQAEQFLRSTANATLAKPTDPRTIRRIAADYVTD